MARQITADVKDKLIRLGGSTLSLNNEGPNINGGFSPRSGTNTVMRSKNRRQKSSPKQLALAKYSNKKRRERSHLNKYI